MIRKSLAIIISIGSILFISCGAEKKEEDKVIQKQNVNSYVSAEEDVIEEEEFLVDARNQEIYSGMIVEEDKDLFYTASKDNNRIYRESINLEPSINKKSGISMMSGSDLIKSEDKIYYCNDQDNSNIYFFEMEKFDENLKPTKFNSFKSRDLVSTKDGLYYINESDREKIYFKSYDGEIEKAVTQDRAAKFIVSDYTVYYQNAMDGYSLYAMDLIEKKTYKLTDFSIESFAAVGGFVIVSNSDDNNSLYRIKGTDIIEKISEYNARNIKVDLSKKENDETSMYFTDDTGNLYKMIFNKDNTLKVNLITDSYVEDYHFTSNKIMIKTNDNNDYESINK